MRSSHTFWSLRHPSSRKISLQARSFLHGRHWFHFRPLLRSEPSHSTMSSYLKEAFTVQSDKCQYTDEAILSDYV